MKNYKVDKCPYCMPNSKGAILDRDWAYDEDGNSRPVWTCRNCGEEVKRLVRRPAGLDGLTASQKRTLDGIMYRLSGMGREFPGKYEWKLWSIRYTDYGSIWLRAEYGKKGDEGTLAEFLGRDKLFCRIGPRGAVERRD